MAPGATARLLRRAGLHRLTALASVRPDNRYEYAQSGQLLNLDIKKLGRFRRPGHRITGDRQINSKGSGWEYLHLAIDDHPRLSFGTIEPHERGMQTGLREWAHAHAYDSSEQRVNAFNGWVASRPLAPPLRQSRRQASDLQNLTEPRAGFTHLAQLTLLRDYRRRGF